MHSALLSLLLLLTATVAAVVVARRFRLPSILAYLAVRFGFPQLNTDIPAGKVAPAIFLAVVSVSVGLINAACMSY